MIMVEEKDQTSYEDLREVVDDYSEDKGHDLLTDPDSVAEVKQIAQDELAGAHGDRLREIREQRGFTLTELAEKTGLDQQTLAQVEAGETFLPLGQLIKLGKALSMTISDFISEGKKPFTIVRMAERTKFARFGKSREAKHGYEYQALAAEKAGRRMEPFIVTLLPAAADEPSSHDGQEFIYVLEGEMEVVVDDAREVLQAGDAIYYDSTSTHLVRAYGEKPAKILAVLVS